jgi:hypothetical protein
MKTKDLITELQEADLSRHLAAPGSPSTQTAQKNEQKGTHE